MSRDQRANDNWALLFAQQEAIWDEIPLIVVFCLVPDFLGASLRHYDFMLKGLQETEKELLRRNIPFLLLSGNPAEEVPGMVRKLGASLLITDFNPLREKISWERSVSAAIEIPFFQVDAHNIVPVWEASDKAEYGAYTIRRKVNSRLTEFLCDFPELETMKQFSGKFPVVAWKNIRSKLMVASDVEPVDWLMPGEKAAKNRLTDFIAGNLSEYSRMRNDPNLDGQSEMSPYLHFGQIAAQRIALEISRSSASDEEKNTFLEELIVRRELSDNFCFFNHSYDSIEVFPKWAGKTLSDHSGDKREFIYSVEEFELGKTHDPLWNAAQRQMVRMGKMHGFLRMYWAKKILEWSRSPEEAMKTAIYLNDRYELDGRDPNGYAGIAWSIGGVHDRPWGERNIFGKIRCMTYNGCRGKFKVKAFEEKWSEQV